MCIVSSKETLRIVPTLRLAEEEAMTEQDGRGRMWVGRNEFDAHHSRSSGSFIVKRALVALYNPVSSFVCCYPVGKKHNTHRYSISSRV